MGAGSRLGDSDFCLVRRLQWELVSSALSGQLHRVSREGRDAGAEQIHIALRVCETLQWLNTALTFISVLFWEAFVLEQLLWWLPVECKPSSRHVLQRFAEQGCIPTSIPGRRPSRGGWSGCSTGWEELRWPDLVGEMQGKEPSVLWLLLSAFHWLHYVTLGKAINVSPCCLPAWGRGANAGPRVVLQSAAGEVGGLAVKPYLCTQVLPWGRRGHHQQPPASSAALCRSHR